ncbi:Heavy-metal resistance [Tepidimonas alkaliphilus]|uniref:Heavy-metal resistance n=1 Tax=Tepidimonas alkaliphilus TaxID=2588942 RepID=A0A554W7W7_9BURK|nr:Spy/CpxP family protein refolding chaperone [Tepidimonas alkaliphilus]TSE19673.1 Heavy-metal resistance [Tepidimonas alkaliphilus]
MSKQGSHISSWPAWLAAGLLAVAAAPGWAAPGMGGPDGRPPHHGPRHPPAPNDEARAERMVEHLTRGLDLQPAQREQVRALAQAASADLRALREEGRALREERHRLLGAPTLDEAALEALRQRELAHHDRLSARMQRFTLDVAKVLTPEQRQRWAERQARRGRPHPPEHGPEGQLHPARR